MARVPYTGDFTAAPSTQVPDDYLRVDMPNLNLVGPQMEKVGAQLGQTGDMLAQHAVQMAQIDDETAANEQRNTFVNQLTDANEAYKSLTGKAAVDGYQAQKAKLNQIYQDNLNAMTNPMARQMFGEVASRYLDMHDDVAAQWAGDQRRVWVQQTAASSLDNMTAQANQFAGDPNKRATFDAGVVSQTQKTGQTLGWDPQTVQMRTRQAFSKAYAPAISQMSDTNPHGAQSLLQQEAPNMDPDTVAQLTPQIQAKVDRADGISKVKQIWQGVDGGTAPSGGTTAGTETSTWTNIARQESGGRQVDANGNTIVSTAGAIGYSQLEPDTAKRVAAEHGLPWNPGELNHDRDYNIMIGRALFGDLMKTYDGNPVLASAAYNAGEGRVNQWITQYGNPNSGAISNSAWAAQIPIDETRNYVKAVVPSQYLSQGASSATPSGSPAAAAAPPALGPMLQSIYSDPSMSDGAKAEAAKYATDRYRAYEQTKAASAQTLEGQLENGRAALLQGKDFTWNEGQIRSILPNRADTIIAGLNDDKALGLNLNALSAMSPDQIQQKTSELQAGLNDPNAPDYQERVRNMDTWNRAIATRNRMLLGNDADPAAYVANTSDPVKAAIATAHASPDDPMGAQNIGNAVIAEQTRLGIPPQMQHVLSRSQSQSMANDIIGSGENVQGKLQQLQQQYGNLWPKVFGDMVGLGKLPASYQSVAVLDPHNGSILARAINETSKSGKDWTSLLGNAGGKEVSSVLSDQVRNDPAVAKLEMSLSRSGASAQQINSVVGSIETLAYGKRFYENDQNAGPDAIKAFTDNYEFLPNGGARVPAKIADAVSQSAQGTLSQLTVDHVAVPSVYGQQGMPKQQEYVDWVKASPTWITSPKSDALWLMDPAGRIVRGKLGQPISVPFSGTVDLAAHTATAPVSLLHPSTWGGLIP